MKTQEQHTTTQNPGSIKETTLLLGDCLDKLKELEDNSIDSIVSDPPYGLAFMGKKWDYDVPSQAIWEECIRVLKPGGHLLSFAGSRTYHRMAVRIEDAGFEIRDQIMWIYGSGFPKSHNVGNAIDKKHGAGNRGHAISSGNQLHPTTGLARPNGEKLDKYEARTEEGKGWEGWGTALKPAHEPIVMARKPIVGTVANNVLEYGVGGINIDGCRIGTETITQRQYDRTPEHGGQWGNSSKRETNGVITETEGRFPANIIFECTCDNPKVKENTNTPYNYIDKNYSENGFLPNVNAVAPYNYNDEGTGVIHTDPNCPCYILDQQSGKLNKQAKCKTDNKSGWQNHYVGGTDVNAVERKLYLDEGGASRFFYCPKASKTDRNEGCDSLEDKGYSINQAHNSKTLEERYALKSKNNHPTVKPTDLMQYLIRLVTPKGGIVLDPFMGSGSTGKAAIKEGMIFVGIEREDEYYQIAKQRIEHEIKKNEPKHHFW